MSTSPTGTRCEQTDVSPNGTPKVERTTQRRIVVARQNIERTCDMKLLDESTVMTETETETDHRWGWVWFAAAFVAAAAFAVELWGPTAL